MKAASALAWAGVLLLQLLPAAAVAQDLDPRAYARVPVGSTLAIAGLSRSSGGVLTDPTLPLDDLYADVTSASAGLARSFGLFGRTAQALAMLPYSWADVTGNVADESQRVTRSGLSDMRLRVSLLLFGGPAVKLPQFVKSPRRPIVGTSLSVSAPTGQYYPQRLINLSTNRWAFKPEVALSYPLGPRWLADVYAGIWFFTANESFYPGASTRTQKPVGALQAHVSYSLPWKAWAALDATWYAGGQASVNQSSAGPRMFNSRLGATLVVAVGTRHAVKVAWSTGAWVRTGTDFTTVTVGWQTGWIDRSSRTP